MKGSRKRAEVADVEGMLAVIKPLAPEEISVEDATGRVLAAPFDAALDVPAFDRSAMDGYAVRGEETTGASEQNPVRFALVGHSLPGRPFRGVLGARSTVRVATGAPLPEGADAVLMAEHSRAAGDGTPAIEATRAVPAQKNVSRRGEDVQRGARLFEAGRVLRPQDLGLLASTGASRVAVVRRPRVDVIVTGDELLEAGSTPRPFHTYDSNSPMLCALVARDGGVLASRIRAPDDYEELRRIVADSAGDVILIAGGSSVGSEDHVPRVIAELGELRVHGIAMRPASPAGVGFIGGRPVFLLPGNPVSCLAAYDFFAGPSIRALGGGARAWPYRSVELRVARTIPSQRGRVDYARVRIVDGAVEPLMTSGASNLSSTTLADGVVIVPGDAEEIAAGERVTVFLYG